MQTLLSVAHKKIRRGNEGALDLDDTLTSKFVIILWFPATWKEGMVRRFGWTQSIHISEYSPGIRP
jgi:hypothetical protein